MEKITQDIIIDTLIERPITFSIGRRTFCIYPVTLGKSLLFSTLIKELGIEASNLETNPVLELMRVCSVQKHVAARIIAYAVCKTKDEIMDMSHINKLTSYFERKSTEDVSNLINTILSHDRTKDLLSHFEIDKELQKMRRVQGVKEGGNDISFCGKSIWGQQIDIVCERYGWTMDYVLWGISYNNLQMLMADQVKTIFLTDEEKKKAHVAGRGDVIHKAETMSAEEMKKILNIK